MIRFPSRRALMASAFAIALALPAFTAFAQSMADIKKKGEITVGVMVDVPPFATTNAKNEPDGYDADVARLLGKDWGVKVNMVTVTGPNRIPYVLTNKVDVLVAVLAITPERSKQVQFSAPYSAATIVVYGTTKTPIKTAADLKGLRVGVTRASTQDVALTAAAPEGTEIRRFDDDSSAMQALISGQVDAIGCPTIVANQISKRVPGAYEEKFVLRQQFMGVVMRPGQDDLLKNLNEFVARNTANGELNKLHRKWLGVDLPQMQ